MAIALDPKQIVSSEELLMSQVVSREAIIRLLVEKGIFSKKSGNGTLVLKHFIFFEFGFFKNGQTERRRKPLKLF